METALQELCDKAAAPGRPETVKTANGEYLVIASDTSLDRARTIMDAQHRLGKPTVYTKGSCVELQLPDGVELRDTRAAATVAKLRAHATTQDIWLSSHGVIVQDTPRPREVAELLVEIGAGACRDAANA